MFGDIKSKDELLEKVHSAIILCLGDRPPREVDREESAAAVWLKLENIYMTKSMANHLYMKQRIKGSGNIKIRMHDEIDRVLTNVRYVPELRRNLISLGTLDDQGYSFKSGGGSLSVSKGSLVIMKAVKRNLLYVLQDKFVKLCKEKDITRHRTMAGTPQQNGLAERMNRTLLEKGSNGKWSGTPADYSNKRVLGCLAYAHLKQDKLEARTVKYIFIGYPDGVKDGKDSQISENLKLPFEVESSVPDTGSDEMQDENVTASGPKEDLSTYNLASDITRREIRAPKRFGEADLAWYALTVAEKSLRQWNMRFDEFMIGIGFVRSQYDRCVYPKKDEGGYLLSASQSPKSEEDKMKITFIPYVSGVGSLIHGMSVVALSTTETEFIAVIEAIKEGLWLKGMIADLDVKMHFIRDVIEKGDVVLMKITSEENPADVMTKSLPYAKFKKCLDLVNVVIKNLPMEARLESSIQPERIKVEIVEVCFCQIEWK
ncbi:uncharacterized protein [Henckelia pumila]|uniref:uncharacterized protein n=1 Tax=Henckelia pumila TaxID=405737 RepID=UPI003C6DD7CA